VSKHSPTLDELLRHAHEFGVAEVFETATENGFTERDLARLSVELDAIEAARKQGRFTVGKRRRRTPAETVDAVRMLRAAGLVVSAIADKLGVTDAYVRRCLKDRSETSEKQPVNPHG